MALKSYESKFSVEKPKSYASSAKAAPETTPFREESAVAAGLAPSRMAVFVVHGMGQQIQFETLDAVTEGLRAEEMERRTVDGDLLPPKTREVMLDGDIYRRVELEVQEPGGVRTHEVHLYEAYWAPKTEGKVTLSDVMSFLFSGAFNGMAHCLRPFRRWMFNAQFEFPASILRLLAILGILAVVLALGSMNGLILAVAAATVSTAGVSNWLTPDLFTDLTAAAALFCLCGICFGSAITIALFRKSAADGRPWRLPLLSRWSLWLFLGVTGLMAVLSAAAMGYMVKAHSDDPKLRVVEGCLGLRAEDLADIVVVGCLGALLAVAAGFVVTRVAKRFEGPASGAGLLLNALFYLTLLDFVLSAAAVAWLLTGRPFPGAGFFALFGCLGGLWKVWVWALLVAVSAKVRTFLVQYMGDVAAYVSSFKVDRFEELRSEVRALALKVAQAIYSAKDAQGHPQYDRIAVVGHSLGSVIAYDTLNCLINNDLLQATDLKVCSRTKLLLTFGSPLDKIAFLFAAQGGRTSETREALVAAVQPLIQDYEFRTFPWVNVYSKSDIIGGPLDFFDDNSKDRRKVGNHEDLGASIPLVAHTEYWKGREVWRHLYDTVCGDGTV